MSITRSALPSAGEEKMRKFNLIALAGVLSASASAWAAPLTPTTLIGGFNNSAFAGASLGFSFGDVTGFNRADGGMFGAGFANSVRMDSITIEQTGDGSARKRAANIDVFDDYGNYLTNITLSDPGVLSGPSSQTITLPTPIVVKSHVILQVKSQHGSGDPNGGFKSLAFGGVDLLAPVDEVNLNLSAIMSTTSPLGGYDFPNRTIDGNILSTNTNQGTYYTRDGTGPDTLKASYTGPTDVSAIGLGIAGDSGRDVPKFVTLTDSFNNSQIVTLDPDSLQFRRYILSTPIVGTSSLTMTFPVGTNTADWYLVSDANYGVTEFQAFGPVPEPATVGLFGIGACVLVRRRR